MTRARRRLCFAAGMSLAGLGLCSHASAQAEPHHAAVRLVYTRDTGAERCTPRSPHCATPSPRAPWLRSRSTADRAPRTLTVVVRRTTAALVSRIELRGAAGSLEGHRELTSGAADCQELAATMAIAMSLGIDPLSANPSPSTPRVAPAPPPVLPSPPPPCRQPPSSWSSRLGWRPWSCTPASLGTSAPGVWAGIGFMWGVSPATPSVAA